MKLRTLSLFAGIGGFDLGLERTGGFCTVAFCEIDPFCRRVLAKHWPEVPCYDDVRTLTGERLAADGVSVDVICGGFPCQDISFAGKGAGLAGERSGLWQEYARLIAEIRPAWVIIENVSALRSRGLDAVLGRLFAIGFDAEWHCIPAAAVGAPHRRDRVWVVGYASGERRFTGRHDYAEHDGTQLGATDQHAEHVANPYGQPERKPGHQTETVRDQRDARLEPGGRGAGQCFANTEPAMANAYGEPRNERRFGDANQGPRGRNVNRGSIRSDVCNTDSPRLAQWQGKRSDARPQLTALVRADWWAIEPNVGRVAHGVPARVDRLRALGNAVVPQVVTAIGHAILAAERAQVAA